MSVEDMVRFLICGTMVVKLIVYLIYMGSYSVEITDSLGCKENLSINLYEPPTYVNVGCCIDI